MAMARRQDDRSQEERSTLVKRSTKTRRTYRRRKKRGKAKVRPLNDDEAEVSTTTTTTLSITQWSEKLSSGSSIDMLVYLFIYPSIVFRAYYHEVVVFTTREEPP